MPRSYVCSELVILEAASEIIAIRKCLMRKDWLCCFDRYSQCEQGFNMTDFLQMKVKVVWSRMRGHRIPGDSNWDGFYCQ